LRARGLLVVTVSIFFLFGDPITRVLFGIVLLFVWACAEVKKMWIYTSTPPYAFMA
jgi:hypothetical protein